MSDESIKREDQITLPPIKKIIIQILRSIFSIVDHLADVFKKSKLLILAGLISGLAVGFSYYNSRAAYFEVSMIAQSSVAYRKTLSEMVQSLNGLILSKSYQKMAEELKITEPQSRQISYLELTNLLNESLEKDTSTKLNEPFIITARINDSKLTDTFQHAIVNYLNNKPAFQQSRSEQILFYNEKLSFINKELGKLDSLKTEYNRFLASSKGASAYYSNDVDLSTIYKQSNSLVDEKGSILLWLSTNSKPLLVIDEFKSPAQPQSSSRVRSIIFGGLIGAGICFLLGLYLELYRKTKNYK